MFRKGKLLLNGSNDLLKHLRWEIKIKQIQKNTQQHLLHQYIKLSKYWENYIHKEETAV